MRKFIPIAFALALILCLGVAAVAEEEGELEFSYQEEVTVSPDEFNAPGAAKEAPEINSATPPEGYQPQPTQEKYD